MHSFLPDFCGNRTVFIVVIAAELLAFMLTLTTLPAWQDFWQQLAMSSFFIQWVALGTVALLCYLGEFLARQKPLTATLLAYSVAQIVTLISSLLALWIIHNEVFYYDPMVLWQPYYLFRNLAISSVVCLVVLRYFYIQQQWRQNVQAEARSQLQALQARIRPHFLFNSMNTIASLVRAHPLQAEEMILDLADLFRAALIRKDKVTLDEELDSARRYLRIEQKRLGARLQVEWLLAADLPLTLPVPALILQPLLENAVYHGIQTLLDGGIIRIEITSENNRLLCRISNPLAVSGAVKAESGQGMAQENTRRRLALTYGEESYLKSHAGGDHYQIEMMIPLAKE